jgi:ADP-heptose:LPS heptosyltransferase
MKVSNKEVTAVDNKTATIAILQLTRFGDLIQTTEAIKGLKEAYPGYRVILIARSQFSKPLNFILSESFDKIYHLDTASIFHNTQTDGLKPALEGLNSFITNLNTERINVLINLSFSKSSNYLSSLISAEHKIGPYFDYNNKLQINDKWSQVLYSTVMRGSLNPYSLVDLFRNIIGLKPNEETKSIALHDRKNVIICHPFASSERKSWKPEKWVEIIYKALKDNDKSTIAIVGAKNEVLKSQMIVENPLLKGFSFRLVNLTGKTSLEELSVHIRTAKLFVGHDSMVGHMAALYKTPTLTISLGNVRPHETTPYHENAYNLSPRTKCFPCFPSDACGYTQCHHDIPYQVVSNLIKQLMNEGKVDSNWMKNSNSSFHLSSVNLYKAQFVSGQMVLDNLVENTSDSSENFRTFYKITWGFVIGNTETNLPFPKLSNGTHSDLLAALSGIQHLFELSDFGKRYSKYILEEISSPTPSIAKIKDFSKKIDEIDHLQSLVQKTSPYLAPIIDYFTVRKANLFGDNIVKLTESSYYCFEECAQLCSILYELVENTIAEHKLTTGKIKSRNDLTK